MFELVTPKISYFLSSPWDVHLAGVPWLSYSRLLFHGQFDGILHLERFLLILLFVAFAAAVNYSLDSVVNWVPCNSFH
jgi:hypothetical protein